MTSLIRLTAVASIGALAFAAAACTPAETDADGDTDTTIIETREVPADPVIIEREVPAPNPPVVIESDRNDGDSTTVRANKDGIEVETTNR